MTGANWIKPISQNVPQCGAGDTKMQKKWHQTTGRMCKRMFGTSRSIRFLMQLHGDTTIIGVVIYTSCDAIARAAREKSGKVMRKRGKVFSLRSKCPPLRSLLLFTSRPAANKNTREGSGGSATERRPISAHARTHARTSARNFATAEVRVASALLCHGGTSSPTSSTVRGMQIRYSLINIVPLTRRRRRRRHQGVGRRLQICEDTDSAGSALHQNTLRVSPEVLQGFSSANSSTEKSQLVQKSRSGGRSGPGAAAARRLFSSDHSGAVVQIRSSSLQIFSVLFCFVTPTP